MITAPSKKYIPNPLIAQFLKNNTPKKELKVRITAYWARGGNTDSWSAKRQSSTGVKT
jgi:hypothetical protein